MDIEVVTREQVYEFYRDVYDYYRVEKTTSFLSGIGWMGLAAGGIEFLEHGAGNVLSMFLGVSIVAFTFSIVIEPDNKVGKWIKEAVS